MQYKKFRKKKIDYSYNHIQNPLDSMEVKRIFDRAYTKALKFLSFRPRSEKEIRDFLSKKEFDETIVNQAIELLKSQKFLSDKDFAEWWIRGRQNSQAKSKAIIKAELQAKGIDRKLIEETTAESQDDFEVAKKYFEKRKSRFEKYSGPEYFQKAAAFLQRRGFSWDVVMKVLKHPEE